MNSLENNVDKSAKSTENDQTQDAKEERKMWRNVLIRDKQQL